MNWALAQTLARNSLLAAGVDLRGGARQDISLSLFKAAVYRGYEDAAHLRLLDDYLTQVTRYVETRGAEGVGRLIIAMPPRHGKTLTVSRLYPIWHLGRNPSHRVMLVSYGQGLANKNSRSARNLLRSRAYGAIFPGTALARDSQSVMEWTIADTNNEGGADALGMGGGATGKGAHLLVLDDPVKNREQAESQTYRDKVWDSYTDDLYTRLEPGGAVIVMATRWHQDDLTGRLLKREGDKWQTLILPALAAEGDALGREVGAALWSDRYDEAALRDIARTQGEYSFAALYMQEPRPAEGGIIKRTWFEPRVRVVLPVVRSVRYWDLAMSSRTGADYTVGLRLDAHANGEHTISDIVRGQVELHDLPRFITDVMLADGPEVVQGFEQAGYMTRAIQALAKDTRLARHVIRGYVAHADKVTRVLPFAARAALGVVKLAARDWADAYIEELTAFPYGEHDDQVDASSGAWEMINEEPKTKPIKATGRRYA
jgi:predicted phage terminase large subunit-like protein